MIANAFKGIKLAVGILILDAGRRMLLRMPKKPLPAAILLVSLALMLAVSFFSLRLSSIVLMLGAAVLCIAVYAAKRKGGGAP